MENEKKNLFQRYCAIFYLTFSNIVYIIPYLSLDFYSTYQDTYNLSHEQMGFLISAYAMTSIPGYFIGGWLADKFEPKKLMVLSCTLTALVTIGVALSQNYSVMIVLYLLFGITGTMLNWGAYLKTVRSLGTNEEQGRLLGMSDAAYSIFGLLMTYGALFIIGRVMVNSGFGMRAALLLYAAMAFLIGLVILFAFKPSKLVAEDDGSETIRLSLIGKALKMPLTWYTGLFILGFFTARNIIITYANPYIVDLMGASAVLASGLLISFRTLSVMVLSPTGGMLRDRMGTSVPLVRVVMIVLIALALVMMLIPASPNMLIVFCVVIALFLAAFGLITCTLYTPIAEGGVPVSMSGTVIGIASAIGYSSDYWLYSVCGKLLDQYGNEGYRFLFVLTIVFLLLSLLGMQLLSKEYKKRKMADSEKVQ